MEIKTGVYTGNGTDNHAITGVGFQPDFVIVKSDISGNDFGVFRTSSMGTDVSKPTSDASTITTGIKSLDTDGFTIGTGNSVNFNGDTYHFLAIIEHASDFKVGTYTGDGNDNRSITGVGFEPNLVIVANAGAVHPFLRFGTQTTDVSERFQGGGTGDADHIQDLEADGFQLGSHADVNENGTSYFYIAVKSISGFTINASYTGNGNDARSITGAGFQPDDVWVNDTSQSTRAEGRWRPSSLTGDASLQWDSGASVANAIQALESDGFQVGTAGEVNTDTVVYNYYAWKDGDSQAAGAGIVVLRRRIEGA